MVKWLRRDLQRRHPLLAMIPKRVVRHIGLMPKNLPTNWAAILHLHAAILLLGVLAG
jgi:hypothetical protein